MEKRTVSISAEVGPPLDASIKRRGAIAPNVMYETSASYVVAEPRELPGVFGSVSDGTVMSENYEDWLQSNWNPLYAQSLPTIAKRKS